MKNVEVKRSEEHSTIQNPLRSGAGKSMMNVRPELREERKVRREGQELKGGSLEIQDCLPGKH